MHLSQPQAFQAGFATNKGRPHKAQTSLILPGGREYNDFLIGDDDYR